MNTHYLLIDTNFNLVKSKVDIHDLRAYLYQCIYDPYNKKVCLQDAKKLDILLSIEQLVNWNDSRDLKLLDLEQLVQLFDKLGYPAPESIYYFYPAHDFRREDYRSYPQIFSSIESLSFDIDGLIVLHSDILHVYHLFSTKGTELLRSDFSAIKIGMNGLIQFDGYESVEEISDHKVIVNQDQIRKTYDVGLYNDNEENFPDIKGRDKISLMEDWTAPLHTLSDFQQLTNEEAQSILKDDGLSIRYMSKPVQQNEELAFIACRQNKLAFTLLPEDLQNNSGFRTKLLDSKDVDTDIRNYIYFERIIADTSLAEETRIKNPLLPLWSPLITDKFDPITPNLTKKEPDYFELLAYLYQLTNCDFVFAEPLTIKYYEVLNSRPVEEIMLDTELQKDIEDSLWKEGCYPQYIYIFNQRIPITKTDFKTYPRIYTDIVDVTFDCGGLLVMESYCDQVYSLHDTSGDILLNECSDIIFGMNALIAYRYCDDLSGQWTFERYENGRLIPYGPDSENYINYDFNLNGFPFIHSRDRIPHMKTWEEHLCQPLLLNLLWKREIITNILKKDGCLIRHMQGRVKEDEEFALLACQKEIAFTLVSPKLQHDKSFVIKLYSMPNIDVNLFNFFSLELQNDSDIINLKLEKIRIEEELYAEHQKDLISKYGEPDELPF